jgi:tRNA pseudouridine55 synthase
MNGVINIYKPKGITSFDVVRKLKKICNTKKIGHTGTLDPEAEGVLPVCIGRATKIVDYLMSDFKVYKTVLKLGVITDTYDAAGKILSEKDVSVTEEEGVNVINSFKGDSLQEPPMYSALKINGVRLYELARQGVEVERKLRKITIYSIEINSVNLPYVSFTVKCSKGTYIRSLCYDIGQKLSCGGTMWALERLQSGFFNCDNSVKLEELNSDNIYNYLIPMEDALIGFKSLYFSMKYKKALLNGMEVCDTDFLNGVNEHELYKVFFEDGQFIGIGEKIKDSFKIRTKLILE